VRLGHDSSYQKRQILELRYKEHESIRNIASKLDISKGSVEHVLNTTHGQGQAEAHQEPVYYEKQLKDIVQDFIDTRLKGLIRTVLDSICPL